MTLTVFLSLLMLSAQALGTEGNKYSSNYIHTKDSSDSYSNSLVNSSEVQNFTSQSLRFNGTDTKLCWLEIIKITECADEKHHPIVSREYQIVIDAVSNETETEEPEKCNNDTTNVTPRNENDQEEYTYFKVFDSATNKSGVLPFKTTEKNESVIVRQYERKLCGDGPVLLIKTVELKETGKVLRIKVNSTNSTLSACNCHNSIGGCCSNGITTQPTDQTSSTSEQPTSTLFVTAPSTFSTEPSSTENAKRTTNLWSTEPTASESRYTTQTAPATTTHLWDTSSTTSGAVSKKSTERTSTESSTYSTIQGTRSSTTTQSASTWKSTSEGVMKDETTSKPQTSKTVTSHRSSAVSTTPLSTVSTTDTSDTASHRTSPAKTTYSVTLSTADKSTGKTSTESTTETSFRITTQPYTQQEYMTVTSKGTKTTNVVTPQKTTSSFENTSESVISSESTSLLTTQGSASVSYTSSPQVTTGTGGFTELPKTSTFKPDPYTSTTSDNVPTTKLPKSTITTYQTKSSGSDELSTLSSTTGSKLSTTPESSSANIIDSSSTSSYSTTQRTMTKTSSPLTKPEQDENITLETSANTESIATTYLSTSTASITKGTEKTSSGTTSTVSETTTYSSVSPLTVRSTAAKSTSSRSRTMPTDHYTIYSSTVPSDSTTTPEFTTDANYTSTESTTAPNFVTVTFKTADTPSSLNQNRTDPSSTAVHTTKSWKTTSETTLPQSTTESSSSISTRTNAQTSSYTESTISENTSTTSGKDKNTYTEPERYKHKLTLIIKIELFHVKVVTIKSKKVEIVTPIDLLEHIKNYTEPYNKHEETIRTVSSKLLENSRKCYLDLDSVFPAKSKLITRNKKIYNYTKQILNDFNWYGSEYIKNEESSNETTSIVEDLVDVITKRSQNKSKEEPEENYYPNEYVFNNEAKAQDQEAQRFDDESALESSQTSNFASKVPEFIFVVGERVIKKLRNYIDNNAEDIELNPTNGYIAAKGASNLFT